MSDIDQSILDAMTEAEREALLDDDDSDEAIVVLPGDEAADDDEQDDDQSGDDEEADKKAEPDADTNQSADDNSADETAKAPEQQDQPKPLFRAELPADLADKYAALDTKEEELIAKFDEGDMTTREYNAELRKLNEERNDLKWLERKAELSQETLQQQQETLKEEQDRIWFATARTFADENPVIEQNEENWNSFDQVVRVVTAVQQAAGKPIGRPELERAFKIWADERGIDAKAPAAKDPEPAAKAPAAKNEQKKELPPTLAKVPAASNEDTDDGKFAALERLMDKDPQAYQAAIAKMSPSEYDAYTKFSG